MARWLDPDSRETCSHREALTVPAPVGIDWLVLDGRWDEPGYIGGKVQPLREVTWCLQCNSIYDPEACCWKPAEWVDTSRVIG